MNPEQYEHHVAAVLAAEGWATTVSRLSRDMGIDVLAERDGRRLAVQAKMYGGSGSKVNAEWVMCLFGAAAYADCPEQMIATDGDLTSDAWKVAKKLGVEIRNIPAEAPVGNASPGSDLSFGAIWERHVRPLQGRSLERASGKVVKVVKVDGSGVRRITSGGNPQLIKIETFRWAIDQLLANGHVKRSEIHSRAPGGRASSGVVLILSEVPVFELFTVDGEMALRLRDGVPSEGL